MVATSMIIVLNVVVMVINFRAGGVIFVNGDDPAQSDVS